MVTRRKSETAVLTFQASVLCTLLCVPLCEFYVSISEPEGDFKAASAESGCVGGQKQRVALARAVYANPDRRMLHPSSRVVGRLATSETPM